MQIRPSAPFLGCLVGIVAAVGLTAVIAPVMAALRPPTVVRLPFPTAEMLDAGDRCAYTWGGQVYVLEKAEPVFPCPSKDWARVRWDAVQLAQQAVQVAQRRADQLHVVWHVAGRTR